MTLTELADWHDRQAREAQNPGQAEFHRMAAKTIRLTIANQRFEAVTGRAV